jgi:hypothetical protein
MAQEIKKSIKNVSINYEDGSRDELQYYALAGLNGDTWYHVMLSPAGKAAKIKLNNLLVELSTILLKAIG